MVYFYSDGEGPATRPTPFSYVLHVGRSKKERKKMSFCLIFKSGTCESSDVLMLAKKISASLKGLTSKMFLAKLTAIWGDKLDTEEQKDKAGGRFVVKATAKVDLDKNWRMTLFLLEIGLDRCAKTLPRGRFYEIFKILS
jgi:hypothetical protein